ncbi:VOC family protein [Novosphingobium sp.]|uniref:VOC family protein n=1 Tax=Novosphingobium sp. TaxID=1874826 RepID=UPI0025F29CE8|nr:VOC family protein [Novosphingobium sp.]
MISGLHHVGLAAADIATAARFHGALTGATPNEVAGGLLTAINVRIELHQASGPATTVPALNRPGIRHLCVQNFDCGRLEAAVITNGGSLIAPPLDLGTGNMYAYARDPEGNIVEIEGLPYAPPEQPNWAGHVALVTCDIDATLRFYSALLGTQASGPRQVGPSPAVDRMGGMSGAILNGAWLSAGNIGLEFWQFREPVHDGAADRSRFYEPGFSHLAFESDDPARDMERAITLGAIPADRAIEPRPTPGALDSRFVSGPDGVLIEFVRMASSDLALAGLADRDVVARIEAGR